MPKYEVVQPIETGGKLYIPESGNAPKTVKSFSHGKDIPVDASGLIELSEDEAKALPHAVRPLKKYREQNEPEQEGKTQKGKK